MRLNKYIASATDLSRRKADEAIAAGQVTVNGQPAEQGQDIGEGDIVSLQGRQLHAPVVKMTIILNKPVGYVVSRQGQGSRTIYDILPPEYHHLNPVGRLDKDSSGLLLLTNDGDLANELTHPRHQKVKIYEVTLDKPLQPLHQQMISDFGVTLDDGPSKFLVTKLDSHPPVILSDSARENEPKGPESVPYKNRSFANAQDDGTLYEVQLHEGRNRQIRRTFAALGYTVQTLHRTHFGPYDLGNLRPSETQALQPFAQGQS